MDQDIASSINAVNVASKKKAAQIFAALTTVPIMVAKQTDT